MHVRSGEGKGDNITHSCGNIGRVEDEANARPRAADINILYLLSVNDYGEKSCRQFNHTYLNSCRSSACDSKNRDCR